MHIARMRIKEEPPFTKEVTFTFHERVNLFIGPNATGKSTLLSSLANSSNEQRETWLTPSSDWFDDPPPESARGFVNNYSREYGRGLAVDRPAGSDRAHPNWDKLPWVHIPAERISLPKEPDFLKFSSGERHDQKINEFLQHDGRYIETEKVCKALLTLYDHESTREAAVDIDTCAFDCTRKICHDVLTGDTPRHYEGAPIGFDLMRPPEKEFRRALMGADTIDKTARPLFLGKLSSGTQGVYLWMLYLALKIADSYHGHDWNGFQRDWKDQPAIILIDEIENHLHPLWQRRVIPALMEAFPNAQIFAATHSPFIVAGLKVGQVNRLYRDEYDAVQAQTNDSDIVGWTVEDILREFMEVDDPTDLETSDAAAALRWLRYQHPGEGTAAD